MKRFLLRWAECALVAVLSLLLVTPQDVLAQQNHVVKSSDLQKDVAAASEARQRNVAQLEGFLSSAEAQRALKSSHMNPEQVTTAVRQLGDDDLAQLSARSAKAQKEFAAGSLSDRDLLIIIVAVAALILIIVAVR